ncbi:MAG: hypothetical protein E6Q97_25715 [Desulfurellales bacterium]|nr:MAG: hypothetical protein E6Q97_25715 [Desulfurellales bacterium]
MDISQMQRQIESLDDRVLTGALSQGTGQVPGLLMMMEMARRSRMREQPMVPAPRTSMAQELAMGMYRPVPDPPMKWPDLAGYAQNSQMPGQSMMQGSQNLDLTQPAGIGALFSQR